MFKRFILCLLVSIIFISCPNSFIDIIDVHCELDKETYQKNEPITLSYYGSFKDSSDIGSVGMYFCVHKEGERWSLQELTFPESDKHSPVSTYLGRECEYHVKIKDNEKLTEFNDSIILSIQEAGNYELLIVIEGHSKRTLYDGNTQAFTFPITITE